MKKMINLLFGVVLAFCVIGAPSPSYSEINLTKWQIAGTGVFINNPLADPRVVGLYDFVGKEFLIGGEGDILTFRNWKNVALTFGGAFDAGDSERRDAA